jgi:SAM-dependent methyltransferase
MTAIASSATVRQTVEDLAASAWSLAAISASTEAGLIDALADEQTPEALAEACALPAAVVVSLLDVLVTVGFVTRHGSLYAASPAVVEANAQWPGVGRAFCRAALTQVHDLYRRGRGGTLNRPGWSHTDPDLLQAQGTLSGAFARLLDAMPEVVERISARDAAFLDVGAGVGAIAIGLCRRFGALHCVALEPQEAPLVLARRNIEAAGLAGRIDLRRQPIEELEDVERYDVAWLPLPFLPTDIVEQALRRAWRALKPGGWALVASIDADGDDLAATTARLRCALWGGAPVAADELAELLTRAGFVDVRPGTEIPLPQAPTRARKPAG